MNLSQLPKLINRAAKRVGRGIGSGKGGHTTGRGVKGQKAREDVKIFFEGRKMKKSMIKRLPFQRGKNKFKTLSVEPVIISKAALEKFTGQQVTVEALVKQKLVTKDALYRGVKLLGKQSLKEGLEIKVPTSGVKMEI
jgi:large subunit ribosomal protein L15